MWSRTSLLDIVFNRFEYSSFFPFFFFFLIPLSGELGYHLQFRCIDAVIIIRFLGESRKGIADFCAAIIGVFFLCVFVRSGKVKRASAMLRTHTYTHRRKVVISNLLARKTYQICLSLFFFSLPPLTTTTTVPLFFFVVVVERRSLPGHFLFVLSDSVFSPPVFFFHLKKTHLLCVWLLDASQSDRALAAAGRPQKPAAEA